MCKVKEHLVKQDINFMEYPLWIQNNELANKAENGYIWKDIEGYIYRAGYKPPVKTDFIFLLYLLLKSQREGWTEKITLTKYEMLNACNIRENKWWYDRLEDSLKRWEFVRLEFNGTFYDGKSYKTLHFGVIDSWGVEEETQKLKVRLSLEWILRIKESNFFKYINFEQIKTLRSPLVIRLYEILIKSFQNRNKWEINAMKLAQKIPMNEKYPSDVIPKIKAAINRINKHTTLKVKLTDRRPKRGKAIFVFEKLIEEEVKQLSPTAGLPEDDNFKSLIALLPTEHRDKKTILEAIASSYKKHGFDYTARNIKYTNRHSKGNYRAYLNKALKEDWGLAIKEDEENKQKIIKEEQIKNQQEQETLKQQRELHCQVKEYMKTLSPEELETLREESIGQLDEKTLKNAKKIGNFEFLVTIGMEDIVGEQLKSAQCR
jgi:hypothetical protein